MTNTIDAVVMDVDGVLTDGGFWWTPQGEELKRFCFLDVMGVSIGKKAGLTFGLISGESTPFAGLFAEKMGIAEIHIGCKDKASALRGISDRQGIALKNICYIGDDINDLSAMEIAGLSAAPANAHASVLSVAKIHLKAVGGNGAVRELIDRILEQHR